MIDDARFRHPFGRVAERGVLTALLNERLAERDAAEWVTLLNARGVPCGPINSVAEACADPQVRARDMLVELPHPRLGVFKTTGLPVKLSETPGGIRAIPPELGADTDAVLASAGYNADDIAALRRLGVV